MDRRVVTRLPSSVWTVAWFHFQNPAGSRVHLIPWSACLIGGACVQTTGEKSTWFAAPDRPLGISWRRHTGDR